MNKLLVVDNEKEICSFVESFFRERDYIVNTALNGIEALKKIRSFKPDLVLLDVLMPVMDGIKTFAEARILNRFLKVVMLTGLDEEDLFVGDMQKDENIYYLHKPIKLCELQTVVKGALTAKNKGV